MAEDRAESHVEDRAASHSVSGADPRERLRASVEELTARLDPARLGFARTDELHPLEAVFGQERAVRAIEFSLGMEGPGYNLYAAGPDGFGKHTVVEAFLKRRSAMRVAPPDWVYVRNFVDPDRPVGIALPPGRGRAFAAEVEQAVHTASQELRQAFESDSYARQQQELGQELERRRSELLDRMRETAEGMGFALQLTPGGIVTAPLIEGKPIPAEAFEQLSAEQRQRIDEAGRELELGVREATLEMRALKRETLRSAQELDEQVARFAIEHLFEPLVATWGSDPELRRFLDDVREDILQERDQFRQQPKPEGVAALLPGLAARAPASPLARYEVNALVCNDPDGGAPVITEQHPTYQNLLGRIEYQGQLGTLTTDHTLIKPGSLTLANGGFLVVRLRDLLQNPQAYDGLKRALLAGTHAIENLSELYSMVPTSGLRPEPIPLDVKVVIVGETQLYQLLYRLDPDFRELFRVKADFEVDVPRTDENVRGLAAFVAGQCDREGMQCFGADAVARLVEHSSREVEDQRRLSANMGALHDLLRQTDYWARQEGVELATAAHVDRALEEREYRSALVRDRIQQLIDDGTIFLDVEGSRVGQINALSVYDLGDISFGRPSRISCVTSAGRGAIVHVDRETDMAGAVHNKGFLILRGFLADRFGQHRAMALHASLTFEQLYGQVDGDSASSTELYVLLSALAEAPIDQAIAVTGSVNQRGQVQPIGGATAKIEGFYEVCRSRGLTGTQGVIVPRANVANVTLRPEVADAVAAGRFHVWGAETIEEGIEILTGVPAGAPDADGVYPEGTLFRRAADRLDEFARTLAGEPAAAAGEGPRIGVPLPPVPTPPGIPPEPPPEPPVRL